MWYRTGTYVGSPAVFYGMFPSSLFHHPLAQSLACIRRNFETFSCGDRLLINI
jgi:hypothetical protein